MKRAVLPVHPIPPVVEAAVRPSEPEEDEREDSYREAAEFYLLKRVPPGEELPVERYLTAKQHAERMPLYSLAQRRFVGVPQKSAPRDANLGSWQPLGPGNVGGRTRALLINPNDPNTIYAGSVGGGVWKTTDGGASWNPLTDLLPSIGIGTMAMDPQDPNTLYAGTGEYYTGNATGNSIRGLGIFKSTDGGATWAQLAIPTPTAFYYVNKIVVSPNDSRRVYAATYGGVWFSPNAGATWTRTLDRTSPDNGCQDLVIRTDQPSDYLFAACGTVTDNVTQVAVFRNMDAAGSGKWESVLAQDSMARTSLALAPSNQSIVYAISADSTPGDTAGALLAVYRSDSNGDSGTWNTQTSNQDSNRLNTVLFTNPREAFADVCTNGKATYSNQGGYDNTIAVDPLNPDTVWVGGIDVFRSDDGGKNWGIAAFWQASAPQLAHADVHGIVFAPGYNGADNQTLFAISDGGVYRTDNANAATATGDLAACAPYPTKILWTNINNGYAVTQFYHGAVYPGGGAYWGGTQDNGTVRGSDGTGALNWREILTGDGGYVAVDPNDPNIVYGESQNRALARSTNGGISFTSITPTITEPTTDFLFITPYLMDPSLSTRLYIGGKELWRTANGGQLWVQASNTIPAANGSVSAIAISPSDPTHVVFGTSTGYVYQTPNALTSDKTTDWVATQPRSGYLSHLEFDPGNSSILYATYSQFLANTSQSHVYRSTNGGATWTGIDSGAGGATGLPDIPVFTLIVDPQNTSTLYLGTDIGVFVSLDGGGIWARDDNPFANAVTETLVLDRSAGQSTLFAFTHGRGVWKVALPGSGSPCSDTLSGGPPASLPAFGAVSLPFTVTAGDNCAWSALQVGNVGTVQSPAGGKGSGSFAVLATVNNTALPRAGSVIVQDQVVALAQDAALVASGNDESASAFDIGALPAVAIENTNGATEAASDPVHSCTKSQDSKTLWFKVAVPGPGTLRFSFANRRLDDGADSGTVLTAYPLVGGAIGAELVCSLTPQATNVITTRNPTTLVAQAGTYAIEVSATTFGAPAAAQLMGGNLTLSVQLLP
jgi:hypothetical protein